MSLKKALKVAWALTPIGAIANLIRITSEHGREDVVGTIIGSAPYYPPNDSGEPWVKVEGQTASGSIEHTRLIRKGTDRLARERREHGE